jgi:hypothetical protein
VFTLIYIRLGVAREGNPFMETAMGGGAVGFMIVKLTLVSLCVLLLVRLRERNAAGRAPEYALVASAMAYASLVIYHLAAVPSVLGATS